MVYEFKLPDLGEGVQEGEVIRWLVEVGEEVQADQSLVEVMTDKVTAELPSPVSGKVVALEAAPGDVRPVGATLITLEVEPATDSPLPTSPSTPALPHPVEVPSTATITQPSPNGDGVTTPLAVPAVRRLARELGVDLVKVTPTGAGGRVTEADIRAAAGPQTEVPATVATTERIPLRGVRRAAAEHLVESHRSTAPYTLVEEVDFTELVGLRERVRSLAERAGVRLTYLPFILTAVGMALREHPRLNAVVDPETGDLLVHTEQHLGIACNTDEGLLVPVVRNVESRQLLDLATELERLTNDARAGTLPREAVQGGTFTVSSLGAGGGLLGTPVLNTPQVAVLSVHRIAQRPVIHKGEIVARQMGNICLTLDHRYVDGHDAAHFLETLKRALEDPAVMLFWLAELRG